MTDSRPDFAAYHERRDGCMTAIGCWCAFVLYVGVAIAVAMGVGFALEFVGVQPVLAYVGSAVVVGGAALAGAFIAGRAFVRRYERRMMRERNLPAKKGDTVFFTHGPLQGRAATVVDLGRTSFEYSVRLDGQPETDEADRAHDRIWCVDAEDITRVP